MSAQSPPRLVLASTSRYRRELLTRLRVKFETIAPDVDEMPVSGEAPSELALRLACAKASAARATHPDALIIGCDQVAVVGPTLLNKPGNHDNAVRQLELMSGQPVLFYTALCLLNASTLRQQSAIAPFTVFMRKLTSVEIERYLLTEQPYDCAGSARIEGLGITLVERLKGDDPNALIGLPLIKLCEMLRNEGVDLP